MRLTVASLYRDWMDDSLVQFLAHHGVPVDEFAFFEKPPASISNKRQVTLLHVRCLAILFPRFYQFRQCRVLCLGGHYAWMAMTRLFEPLLPPDFRLYLFNFYLHELGQKSAVKRILRLLLNSPRIKVIAQSPEDQSYFAELSPNEVGFVPYCEVDINPPAPVDLVPDIPYIFAGGYSNRDYEVLLACARAMPEQHFVVAASRLNRELFVDAVPANVQVFTDVDFERFHGLLERCMVAIIPLKRNVGSSGQMVCIAAMRFGKPIIYTDIPAINYYFEASISGLPYSIGDADSLISALHFFLGLSPEGRERFGRNARQYYLTNYTKEKGNAQLMKIITDGRCG